MAVTHRSCARPPSVSAALALPALGLALAAAGCRERPGPPDPGPAASSAALTPAAPRDPAPAASSASPASAALRPRFRLLYRVEDPGSWGASKRTDGVDRAQQEWSQRVHGALPSPYDRAARSAPWRRHEAVLVVGGGGPTLMLGKAKLARWDGDRWSIADAPWPREVIDAARLADGATLVTAMTDTGALAHLIGPDGVVSPALTAEDGAPLRPLRIARVDDQAFLLVSGREPGDALAYGSRDPEPTRLAPLLAPGKRRDSTVRVLSGDVLCPPPAPGSAASGAPPAPASGGPAPASASGGWAAFAAPAASALPCDQPGSDAERCRKESLGASSPLCLEAPIPPPAGFHAACKAPFVLAVVRPRDLNEWSLANGLDDHSYPLVREALSGHPELAGHATLLAFQRERRVYLGAQTDTEATARAVMELLSARKIKPQLGCLDALGHLPDRQSPPRGVLVMDINFATGELLF